VLDVHIQDLGRIRYKEAWDYQEELLAHNISIKKVNRGREISGEAFTPKQTKSHFLFCEHEPVYTLGKSGAMENLLVESKFLKENGIEFFKTNRGGDITFHGPGQIVVYPILDLDNFFTDVHKYLRCLEQVIIMVLNDYNINAGRIEKQTGVWLDYDSSNARKICALGIRASRWVTMHGLAFNINTDLSYFNHIVPCGIQDKAVTSLENELNQKLDLNPIKENLSKYFAEVFDCQLGA